MSRTDQTTGSESLHLSREPILTIAQFCAVTGFSTTLVDVEINSGRLPVRGSGGRTFISMDDATRYLRGEFTGATDDPSRAVERAAKRLGSTAYHEAGHVVASWAMQRELGYEWCPFLRVLIRRPEETTAPYIDYANRKHWCLGLVEGRSPYHPRVDESLDDSERQWWVRELRPHMEAEVIFQLAGPMAEARYGQQSRLPVLNYWGAQDYELARRAAADYAYGNELWSLLDALWERAAALMGRPDVWRAVVALADELLKHWEIDGVRAFEIVDSAARWKPVGGEEVGTASKS
jgi:hypothetical protein